MVNWNWLQRRFWDFRVGHSTYLAFALSMINFVVLNYNLLVANVGFLRDMFKHLWVFALCFSVTYIPIAITVGHTFYRKKQLPIDQTLSQKENPWVQDCALAFTLLAQDKKDEVERIMAKWLKE